MQDAELIYRDILEVQPVHPDSNDNLFEDPPEFYDCAANYILHRLKDDD